ncbi:MAG: hypothetical protein M1833_003749 [Piccolia ochrophora]|nr:MAG: hypothetical protein M1833_003749 [Piccolia ochrophora]
MNRLLKLRPSLSLSLSHISKRASPSPLVSHPRTLSTTPTTHLPRKDAQDKDSINTESTEYSKSGSDAASAAQEQAAFDPTETDPQAEQGTAGEGDGGGSNPLEVSPANPDVSHPPENDGGAEGGPEKKASGGGSPNKNRPMK